MNSSEVKLNKFGKPIILEDFDTGERYVQHGDMLVNVKSETFYKSIGQWYVITTEGRTKLLNHGDDVPPLAKIKLY